jgi:hypothetical protein
MSPVYGVVYIKRRNVHLNLHISDEEQKYVHVLGGGVHSEGGCIILTPEPYKNSKIE